MICYINILFKITRVNVKTGPYIFKDISIILYYRETELMSVGLSVSL